MSAVPLMADTHRRILVLSLYVKSESNATVRPIAVP
jgi:hypothetical protein